MPHRNATGEHHDSPANDPNLLTGRLNTLISASTHRIASTAARMVIVTAAIICVAHLAGDVRAEHSSPEGFSASSDGLSKALSDAWHATVFIEARGAVMKMGKKPRRRTRFGAGIVMNVDDCRRLAIIVTNAHVITCRDKACEVRVGFGDSSSMNRLAWSEAVRIVSRDPEKDLAFLEAAIPDDARPRAARFTSSECGMTHADRVVSIGWPDLRTRKNWGVTPPPNFDNQVKRHSDGSFLFSLSDYRMRREDNRPLEKMRVVFHNSDVLPGSSGGPVVNRSGHVLGLNTMVLRNGRKTDQHQFCARRKVDEVGKCVHAAIASIELIAEYEHIYSSRVAFSGCSLPFEFVMVESEGARLTPGGHS